MRALASLALSRTSHLDRPVPTRPTRAVPRQHLQAGRQQGACAISPAAGGVRGVSPRQPPRSPASHADAHPAARTRRALLRRVLRALQDGARVVREEVVVGELLELRCSGVRSPPRKCRPLAKQRTGRFTLRARASLSRSSSYLSAPLPAAPRRPHVPRRPGRAKGAGVAFARTTDVQLARELAREAATVPSSFTHHPSPSRSTSSLRIRSSSKG